MAGRHLEDPDVQLMLQVQAGNVEAFEQLVARFAPILVSFMHRFVGSRSVAEDLAQDVFLKIHASASSYRPSAKFKTWLLTIATNLCLNHKRWESKRFHYSLDRSLDDDDGRSLAGQVEDPSMGPRESMSRTELQDRVREAIRLLPDQQRIALILARYEQMSYAEIALAMKVSVMAVKSLLNRAKGNLADRLASEITEFQVPQSGR